MDHRMLPPAQKTIADALFQAGRPMSGVEINRVRGNQGNRVTTSGGKTGGMVHAQMDALVKKGIVEKRPQAGPRGGDAWIHTAHADTLMKGTM